VREERDVKIRDMVVSNATITAVANMIFGKEILFVEDY